MRAKTLFRLLAAALSAAVCSGAWAQDCPVSTVAHPAAPPAASDADGFFPASYEASRDRFRDDCKRALKSPADFCRPYEITADGDPDLTIDLAYFTAQNPRLVVLQSGLHGAEGFAGAAIQAMAFRRHLDALLAAGFDVLMIHAANPFGFRHVRRVDGCNVDLNRNFPGVPDLYATKSPAYVEVRSLVERPGPVGSVVGATLALDAETAAAALRHGADFVAEATHRGQYEFPRGFEFGGKAPSQQVEFLKRELAPLIASHAGDVTFLDLHTGLGAPDTLTVYSGAGWPDPRVQAMRGAVQEAADAWAADPRRGAADPGIRFQTPCDSSFTTSGDVIDFVPTLASEDRVTAVTLEWGTVGETDLAELETNARMVLEQQAWFNGCERASTCAEVKADFSALFNPARAAFQQAVLGQADVFLTRLRGWPDGRFRVGGRPDPSKQVCAKFQAQGR